MPEPRHSNQEHRSYLVYLRLQGYHPLWQTIPGHFSFTNEDSIESYNTTSTHSFLCEFSLDSSPFARCYYGNPIWFLFLSLLGCFRSGGNLSPKGVLQNCSRRSHSGISGSKAACAYPELIAACHALLRRPSHAILQVA
jgi:hypothetical protein